MDAAELQRRVERQRLIWVELAPGKRVQFQRPMVDEAVHIARDITLTAIMSYVRGWEGITERDVIGDEGSDDPAEFSQALAAAYLRDHMGYARTIALAVSTALQERTALTKAVEKKPPTS